MVELPVQRPWGRSKLGGGHQEGPKESAGGVCDKNTHSTCGPFTAPLLFILGQPCPASALPWHLPDPVPSLYQVPIFPSVAQVIALERISTHQGTRHRAL